MNKIMMRIKLILMILILTGCAPGNAPTTAPPAGAPGIPRTQVSPKDGMTSLYVPAGEFSMGNAKGNSDEKPAHKVYVDAFWIDQTEVTNAMYAKCVGAGSCKVPVKTDSDTRPNYYADSQYADYPVIRVDWSQADVYCRWAGRGLPSEAQWEKAARGTDGRTYPWGEYMDPGKVNYNGKDTAKVGSYPEGASPYGALDMAGNVSEWVADWFDAGYYAKSALKNPPGPDSGEERVLKGGSWDSTEIGLRSSFRGSYDPASQAFDRGMRCAANAAP